MINTPNTKCGTVAFIGAPNAGKSTLTNILVGAKVSIVTHKVQTTRTRITGIAMLENDTAQAVLIDTPGIFKPKKRLDRAMVSAAWSGAEDADITCLLIDAATPEKKDTLHIIKSLKDNNRKCVLILNKIDMVKPESLLQLTDRFWNEGVFTDVLMISASKNRGIEDFKSFLTSKLPASEFIFDTETLSDMPNRLLAAEITREKLFLNVHEELPYGLTVETQDWEEFRNGEIKITQVIFVERQNHRSIILGNKGENIKRIGQSSRYDLAKIFQTKVHLFLHVKVKENWQDDAERYKNMGLEFGK